ncbi:MAG: hypothetical protein KDC10_15910, partial [Calditrichaeota bacterium]|nr:hypothetical protein [Calditrichota bacterium]
VHVARGTWTGLYTSPMHGMMLCSDYLFTQDSTDINETILDGDYQGTILDLYGEDTWFVLCGFTVRHGQGQDLSPSAYNHRAGGIQKNGHVHGRIQDCVFRQNRAPRSAPVIYWGTVGSGISTWGDLIIERVACFENEVTNPTGGPSAAVFIKSYQARVLKIDGLFYDGDGNNTIPLVMTNSEGDSTIVNNLTITNSTSPPSPTGLSTMLTGLNGHHYSNIRLIGGNGVPVCGLGIQPVGPDSSIAVFRNIQISGVSGQAALYIYSHEAQLDIDSLTVSNCRSNSYQSMIHLQSNTRGWLRNVHFHHNVSGDSVSLEPLPMLNTRYLDIDNLHFHDNRTIVPADPDPSTSGGNFIVGAQVYAVGSRLHLSNMLFENNRLDDLDDYSNLSPSNAYYNNPGRELTCLAWTGLWVHNIRVLHSRQPNHTPEVYSFLDIDMSRPGSVLTLGSDHTLHADSILVWDVDDGGVYIGSDSMWVSNVEIRDVGRMALGMGDNVFPQAPPWARFSNMLLDNIDATPSYLPSEYRRLSSQALLWTGVRTAYQGHVPVVDFENVTAINNDDMRHLFNFWQPVELHVRNCVFWNNTYTYLREGGPISQSLEYNLLEEEIAGIGNQVGIAPLFDEELGAPLLSSISPAIDAGNPDTTYNDIEDPDNPGFALWPSQGTLRNDIGYT